MTSAEPGAVAWSGPVDADTVNGAAEVLASTGSTEPAEGPDLPTFDLFYARELPRLIAFAQGLCGRPVADDIAQEAMIAAYRHWARVSRYESPEAWVRRVCANQATSVLRRRAAEARALLRLGTREPTTELQASHEAFWAEVRGLPRRQAQVTALRYVYGLSVAEIATTLGCTEGTAKVHLTRARAALAERLIDGSEERS
jgi:RNA polymerase sigma-70 factor, ECF subfamily